MASPAERVARAFTPNDLAKRVRARLLDNEPTPIPGLWRDRLSAVMSAVDLEPFLVPTATVPLSHSAVRFGCLLKPDADPVTIAEAWVEVLERELQVTAAEGLLFEFHASLSPTPFYEGLRPGYKYVKTLHIVRSRTAIALHDYAREVNWRRPILFVSILKLARLYHQAVVAESDLTMPGHRKEFTGRLGVATVLISRFEIVSRDEAIEAVESLTRSLDEGNDPDVATAYLLEAMCVQYDLTGDTDTLERALAFAGTPEQCASTNVAWHMSSVEALMRLHDELEDPDRKLRLRTTATRLLERSKSMSAEAEDMLRWVILDQVVRAVVAEGSQSGLRGFRSAFGFRHQGQNEGIGSIRNNLVRAVSPLAQTGEPLARAIYADLAEHVPAEGNREVSKLRLLIEMRGGGGRWSALQDERSVLLTGRDRLRLAGLTGNTSLRASTLRELATLCDRPTCGTAAMVLIARDVESAGPMVLKGKAPVTSLETWVHQRIGLGDFRGLLADAASDALASPDLSVAPLGGRSGVVTVSDYFDVVGGTFVFKSTTVLQWARELRRSEELREVLRGASLDATFGVVDHLSPVKDDLHDREPTDVVSTVRRFESGLVLSEYVATLTPGRRIRAIARAAKFLGHIHNLEESHDEPVKVRKEVRNKEVGRWLKTIGVPDHLTAFDDYWSCYSGMPMYRRRDAHPLNWLVVGEDRILAVDLEATGWRPMTYEIAQLTEDCCLIEPTDWDSRMQVLSAYLDACGQSMTLPVIEAFEASVAARNLRNLTPPTGFGETLQHGREVLAFLVEHASSGSVRHLSKEILFAWQRVRGLPIVDEGFNVRITDGRRRRISRAMAYHLRHDLSMERDGEGWADVDALADRLGAGVVPSDVILVASDFREPRFAIAGTKVRALYGHTRPADVDHSDPQLGISLFHATSLGVAEKVLLSQGLRPMGRQFVHLSSRAELALAAGARHGPSLLLTVESDHLPSLRHAAESTYVTPRVSSAHLRVVPVACVGNLR